MRLLLSINSLSSGGAERVMAKLANHFVAQGHDVIVVTQVSTGADHYPTQARRLSLHAGETSNNAWQAASHNIIRWWRLRKVIAEIRPDCVIAFMPTANILALLATLQSTIPVIISERVHPPYNFLSPVRRWLQRVLYPRARHVVVLSAHSAAWFRDHLGIARISVIPNAISLPLPDNEPTVEVNSILPDSAKLVLAVGRLVEQKQQDVVLRAFSQAEPDHDWHLVIIGEGADAQSLKEMAEQQGLAEHFTLIPRAGNIQAWFERAAIYVSASQYEGFPNALLEAMACGCAVAVFDCPTGPADIVEHNRNGLLIPLNDADQLSDALKTLMQNPELRERLAQSAAEVIDQYSDSRFYAAWDDLIHAVVAT